MEPSIGIIFAALTDIGSWSSGVGKMARSASADDQAARKKRESARRRQPRTAERTAVGMKWPQRYECGYPRPRAGRSSPPQSAVGFVLHQTLLPPKQNGFHLYRLAALTGRKRILLQLRPFSPVLCRRLCSPGVLRAQALIFGVQYVSHLNSMRPTESLTAEGFERLPTGDCLLLRWRT